MKITHVQEVILPGGNKEVQVVLDGPYGAAELRAFADGLVANAKQAMKKLNLDILSIKLDVNPVFVRDGGSEVRLVCLADPRRGSSAQEFTQLGRDQLINAVNAEWKKQLSDAVNDPT